MRGLNTMLKEIWKERQQLVEKQLVKELEKEIPFYSLRHAVKPGVTGWAQVCYPYGSSVEDSRRKLEYDLYYAKNMSILLDVRIILKTIGVVLFPKGARIPEKRYAFFVFSAHSNASMPPIPHLS